VDWYRWHEGYQKSGQLHDRLLTIQHQLRGRPQVRKRLDALARGTLRAGDPELRHPVTSRVQEAFVRIELVPETVVEESRYWTIAVNLNQNLIGRLILVLNRDAEAVTAVSSPEWSDLHREIARTRRALNVIFEPDQYNYAFLMNQDAQVHLHVVPRYADRRTWSGAQFEDIHYGELFGGDQRYLPAGQLAQLAMEIRRRLPPIGQ
jgi:diadenosine tetraphosphate (Ap4A) HIT family hydrolase